MDFVNYKFVCESVSLPLCSVLFKNKVHARYPCRAVSVLGMNIYSPPTVILLLVSMWMIMVLVRRTQRCYSFPGRKEFILFLYAYFASLLLDFLLLGGVVQGTWGPAFGGFVAMQLSFLVTCFAALATSGLVWIFPTDAAHFCVWISRMASLAAFLVTLGAMFVFLNTSLGVGVFFFTYIVPLFLVAVFALTQLSKLRQINSEIWSYGTLFCALLIVAAAGVMPYFGGMLVVMFSGRYLDGVFMLHLCGIFAVIMVQKLWITDNEQEIECVNTLTVK